LGVKVFNPYAETEKEKYTVSNADYSGDPGWFSTFIRKKFPNYAEKMTTFKKFKKWLG
jgi:hypothetical protein